MIEFGVNLKRFEVSRELGGICEEPDPVSWIYNRIERTLMLGLGAIPGIRLRLFLPESLLKPALEHTATFPGELRENFSIGAQTVFRDDIVQGGNFGAFTANLPAAGLQALGISTVLIGHSEERADKFGQLMLYDKEITVNPEKRVRASNCVNDIIGLEVSSALNAGLSVMACVGETAEERGSGTAEEQFERSALVIEAQLKSILGNLPQDADIVIAYEPRWAIGPGKTPPEAPYIGNISSSIKEAASHICGRELPVLYGGGLKRENSASVGSVSSNDGGLVALTKFTDPIGFDPDELKVIIDLYREGKRS